MSEKCFKLILSFLILTFLLGATGCSQSNLKIDPQPKLFERNGAKILMRPYTSQLEEKYNFGEKYYNTNKTTSFLLNIVNKSDKSLEIYPIVSSVLVAAGKKYDTEIPKLNTYQLLEGFMAQEEKGQDAQTKLEKETELTTGKKSFPGGKIYPGGKVDGLIVFEPVTNKTAEVTVIISNIKVGKDKYTAEFNYEVVSQ